LEPNGKAQPYRTVLRHSRATNYMGATVIVLATNGLRRRHARRCDPFDRMREANVRFVTAGENLALVPTVQVAHRGLMNSPGHRANILYPQFARVGIGIMDGGIRGLMISQEFRN
jgi:uncharacterized protein YkwD